jgi:asparagine synthase (glutamine-hydrolysing)
MCGIGGIIRIWADAPPPPQRAIPAHWLDSIDAGLRQRGPDDFGRFQARAARPASTIDVALVHRRLAVIDPGSGTQPMLARAGNNEPMAVVFNGCIYNHRPLRDELSRSMAGSACQFTSDHSDTEVLLWGWRTWGPALRSTLDGMYAFALWDPLSASVILARDPFGEKPLHFLEFDLPETGPTSDGPGSPGSRVIAFASQAGALMQLWREWSAAQPKAHAPRVQAIASWLMHGFGPAAPLEGFHALEPGQWLRIGAPEQGFFAKGERVIELFAEPNPADVQWPDSAKFGPRTRTPTAAQVEEAIDASVRACLEADAPLGTFLSGGVDSSLITALAHRHNPNIEAFTVRMSDPRYDESSAAARTAQAIGVRHRVLECEMTPADDLTRLIAQIGAPFADSSLLATHWVSRAARQHVKVCLSGDGGDELFAGYERHRGAWALASIGAARRAVAAAGGVLGSTATSQRRGGLSAAAAKARRLGAVASHGYARIWALFEPEALAALGVPVGVVAGLVGASWDLGEDPFQAVGRALDMDRDGPLAQDMLAKVDAASMACALEVRAPLLTRATANLVGRADPRILMPGGRRKALLRQVTRRVIPGSAGAEITSRSKMGFAVPVGEWFKTDFGGMRRLLLEVLSHREAWPAEVLGFEMDRRVVRRMVEQHMAGTSDHTHRLYALLVLALWARHVTSRT